MKLIIDIPDKTYEIIKNMIYFYSSQRSGREATKEILTAIKQGIPLEDRCNSCIYYPTETEDD